MNLITRLRAAAAERERLFQEESARRDAAGYPQRLLSRKAAERWAETRNPHPADTVTYYLWETGLYMSQAAAVHDPRRSKGAFVLRWFIFLLIVVNAVLSITLAIVSVVT